MTVEFSKYHGLGNDFLLVYDQEMSQELARAMSDRHRGVGADGVIVIRPGERRGAPGGADFSFVLFNADGSLAEVSGNGLRCVGKFLYEKGIHTKSRIEIEASGSTKVLELTVDDGIVTSVRVDMGMPTEEGEIRLRGLVFKKVSTGNPHAVTFVDDIEAAPVTEIGPLIENDPAFPNRTNVEFVMADGDVLHTRFWERGVGMTNASGTGSCAALVASGMKRATIRTPGGDLFVERDNEGRLFMSGPAEHVFDGRIG